MRGVSEEVKRESAMNGQECVRGECCGTMLNYNQRPAFNTAYESRGRAESEVNRT